MDGCETRVDTQAQKVGLSSYFLPGFIRQLPAAWARPLGDRSAGLWCGSFFALRHVFLLQGDPVGSVTLAKVCLVGLPVNGVQIRAVSALASKLTELRAFEVC